MALLTHSNSPGAHTPPKRNLQKRKNLPPSTTIPLTFSRMSRRQLFFPRRWDRIMCLPAVLALLFSAVRLASVCASFNARKLCRTVVMSSVGNGSAQRIRVERRQIDFLRRQRVENDLTRLATHNQPGWSSKKKIKAKQRGKGSESRGRQKPQRNIDKREEKLTDATRGSRNNKSKMFDGNGAQYRVAACAVPNSANSARSRSTTAH